jgi:hypothetical protein
MDIGGSMSKHSSAEDKLHINPSVRPKKLPAQRLHNRGSVGISGPPVGTNSRNQFR